MHQASEEVSAIFRRLHRSAHMHFIRSTTKDTLNLIVRRMRKDRRQKVEHVFRTKSSNDTVVQVAERLKDLIARRQQRKNSRHSANLAQRKGVAIRESTQIVSISSSSLDDSDYMGDTSAVSSVIFKDLLGN